MTDFNKILEKAKELESKMKESQEKIKSIKAEGISGGNSVKITLNGDGEIIDLDLSPEILKEITGYGDSLAGSLIIFDGLPTNFRKNQWQKLFYKEIKH